MLLAYCRAARQPAATASASVQNQRSPDAASTCEAPLLVRAFSLTNHTMLGAVLQAVRPI